MITRDFGTGWWKAGPRNNPPPLHVYSPEAERANWYPYERPVLHPVPPGPIMVMVPAPGGVAGDDPTDPTAQTIPRVATWGMAPRLSVGGSL